MILIKKQQDIAENDIKEALIFFFFLPFLRCLLFSLTRQVSLITCFNVFYSRPLLQLISP